MILSDIIVLIFNICKNFIVFIVGKKKKKSKQEEQSKEEKSKQEEQSKEENKKSAYVCYTYYS